MRRTTSTRSSTVADFEKNMTMAVNRTKTSQSRTFMLLTIILLFIFIEGTRLLCLFPLLSIKTLINNSLDTLSVSPTEFIHKRYKFLSFSSLQKGKDVVFCSASLPNRLFLTLRALIPRCQYSLVQNVFLHLMKPR